MINLYYGIRIYTGNPFVVVELVKSTFCPRIIVQFSQYAYYIKLDKSFGHIVLETYIADVKIENLGWGLCHILDVIQAEILNASKVFVAYIQSPVRISFFSIVLSTRCKSSRKLFKIGQLKDFKKRDTYRQDQLGQTA